MSSTEMIVHLNDLYKNKSRPKSRVTRKVKIFKIKCSPLKKPKNSKSNVGCFQIGFKFGSSFLHSSIYLVTKVVQDYERSVTLRLGNLVGDGAKGSGIIFIIPCIDTYCKVDLRTVSFNVPPQEVLTKDLVCIKVDAVVYYRIVDSTASILNVSDVGRSTRRLAAITLRNVVATKTLTEIISERVIISSKIENNLQEATRPWGVDVERVEMKEVRLPAQLQKLMATEAETEREASAKIIIASGEQKSSRFIRDAAATIDTSAYALQLKYLLTIDSVASAHNKDQDIIVFPFPAELAELGAKFIAKGSDKMHKNILRYFQHKNKAAQHVDPVHVDLV